MSSRKPRRKLTSPYASNKPEARTRGRESAKKLADLIAPFSFDLGYPVAYLYIWYESYQKLMRWIGTIAGGMLTFTATFLLKDLLIPDPSKGVRVNPSAAIHQLALLDARTLGISLLLLAGSLIAVLLNLLVTYNWLVAGIKSAVHQLEPAMRQSGYLDETLGRELRSYGAVLSMKSWGTISFLLGGFAGALLLGGIGTYVAATWRMLSALM